MLDAQLINHCTSVIEVGGSLPKGLLNFCNDTRHFQAPAMFMAYPGARVNPLNHLPEILHGGCPVVVYQKNEENTVLVTKLRADYPSCAFVAVSDAVRFTQELAVLHSRAWQKTGGRIFGISGSNGKTTHKEMLAFLLSKAMPGKVVATEKNNNNHLGVPLTLLQISPETSICVLELGSNHPGEIKVLCDLAQPDAGLVTNIGATHLEFFGDEEQVFTEESYLYHAVGKKLFFQNIDDRFLSRLPLHERIMTFSTHQKADLSYRVAHGTVHISGKLGEVSLKNTHLTGAHNLTNLATAWSIATVLFPEHRDLFTQAAGQFRPTHNRSEWREELGFKIYLDAYNANPSSMKVAIAGFFDWLKENNVPASDALLILGDMNELGEASASYHQEVGLFLHQWPNAHCAFIGRFASEYQHAFGQGSCSPDVASFKREGWADLTRGKTHLFIKGSRSLQLESLLAIT